MRLVFCPAALRLTPRLTPLVAPAARLVALAAFCVGCGDMTDLTQAGTRQATASYEADGALSLVDERLVPMVKLFEQRYGKAIGNIPVQILPLSDNRAGTCRLWYDGRREIIVAEQFYNSVKDDRFLLQATVFHELGHCVLDRDHESGKTIHKDRTIYKSLMYPYVFSSSEIYEDNADYYHDELFSDAGRGSLGLRLETGEMDFVEACDH